MAGGPHVYLHIVAKGPKAILRRVGGAGIYFSNSL